MKVIMTGGGTGGHIYPAIAIADEIRKRHENAEILFVGAKSGMEKTIVPRRGYDIRFIEVAGLNRKNPLKNIETMRKLARGKKQAEDIIEDFEPDLVIGTGGYVSAPLVRMAQKAGTPTYIHEQNALPGIANKLLEKRAEKVFLGFEEAGVHFRIKEKQIFTGNPVREEFVRADREKSRAELGIGEDEFALLAFGGSQGAGRINKAMMEVIREYNGADKFKVCLGAGSYYYDAILAAMREENVVLRGNIKIMEYIDDMARYLKAADLVISRSGAITVAETTVCGTPAIFIPSPMVTGNHQYYNALAVSEKGGALVVEEKDLENKGLRDEVIKLRDDPERLKEMSEKSAACGQAKAAEAICDAISENNFGERYDAQR